MLDTERRNYWLRRAMRIVGRYSDPDDVIALCCARAIRSAHTYDPSRDFDAWFATILRTACSRLCSKHGNIVRHELPLLPDDRVNFETVDQGGDEFDADLSQHWQQIQDALPRIPAEQRELLVAHYLNGSTTTELANKYSKTRTAITIRLQRARAALRAALIDRHTDN